MLSKDHLIFDGAQGLLGIKHHSCWGGMGDAEPSIIYKQLSLALQKGVIPDATSGDNMNFILIQKNF